MEEKGLEQKVCLNQVVRSDIGGKDSENVGDCSICTADPKNNCYCQKYRPISIRYYTVSEQP